MHGSSVVAGIGETRYYKRGESPDSEFKLACEAIRRAADDAGIDVHARIDGEAILLAQSENEIRFRNEIGGVEGACAIGKEQ